jgi:hypothetical protein
MNKRILRHFAENYRLLEHNHEDREFLRVQMRKKERGTPLSKKIYVQRFADYIDEV